MVVIKTTTVQEIIIMKTCYSKKLSHTSSSYDELSCIYHQESNIFPFNEISFSTHFVFLP